MGHKVWGVSVDILKLTLTFLRKSFPHVFAYPIMTISGVRSSENLHQCVTFQNPGSFQSPRESGPTGKLNCNGLLQQTPGNKLHKGIVQKTVLFSSQKEDIRLQKETSRLGFWGRERASGVSMEGSLSRDEAVKLYGIRTSKLQWFVGLTLWVWF